jgi:hypothetical protein
MPRFREIIRQDFTRPHSLARFANGSHPVSMGMVCIDNRRLAWNPCPDASHRPSPTRIIVVTLLQPPRV